VIAAETLPSLILTIEKKAWISGLKIANSTLIQGTKMLMVDSSDGMVNIVPSNNVDLLMEKYCTVLKCIKKCPKNTQSGICFHTYFKTLNNVNSWINFTKLPRAVLANGMLIAFYDSYKSQCNSIMYQINGVYEQCTDVYVDVNGFNGPNIYGRDIFAFDLTKRGIYPRGNQNSYDDLGNLVQIAQPCTTSLISIPKVAGVSCAFKVINENAMNY